MILARTLRRLRPALLLWLFLPSSLVGAEETLSSLVFSYWEEAGAPFVQEASEGQLNGGLLYVLGRAIASDLGYQAEFRRIPVRRVEPEMNGGRIDLTCLTHPQWWDHPQKLLWTSPLVTDADALIVRRPEAAQYDEWNDLVGKTIGVFRGYTYHPKLAELFDTDTAKRLEILDQERGLELLTLHRIDAQVEFRSVALDLIRKKNLENELAIAPHIIEEFELSCAVNPRHEAALPIINARIEALSASALVKELQKL